MPRAIKKTISLPFELAKEIEDIAREERKTLSAVIQEALKVSRKERLKKEKGIVAEKDLKRYLSST